MSDVSDPPPGAKFVDPSIPPPADPPPRAVPFGDPPAFQASLTSLHEHILDVIALAEEAAKPVRARMVSPPAGPRPCAIPRACCKGRARSATGGLTKGSVPVRRKLSIQSMHVCWKARSPTDSASSTIRMSAFMWAQMANARRVRIPVE